MMENTLKYIAVLLAGVLLSNSCKEKELPQVEEEQLSAAADEVLVIDEKAQDVFIDVAANTEVTLEKISQPWLVHVPEGTKALERTLWKFHAEENTARSTRTAHILFSYLDNAGEKQNFEVRVIQNRFIAHNILRIRHHRTVFPLPQIIPVRGGVYNGRVQWDEGMDKVEFRPNLYYEYPATGRHLFLLEGEDAKVLTLKQLEGIEEIDLSEF